MKKQLVGWSLIAGSMLTVPPARADFTIGGIDVGFQPRLTGGAMYYEYEQPTIGVERAQLNLEAALLNNNVQAALTNLGIEPSTTTVLSTAAQEDAFKVSTWLPTIGGGATFFVDRFFMDGYAQHAFQTSDSTNQRQNTAVSLFSQGTTDSLGAPVRFDSGGSAFSQTSEGFDVDVERTEWSISAGYAITNNLSVYAGYKRAETSFDQANKQGVIQQQTSATVQAFDATTGAPLTDGVGNPLSSGQTISRTGTISRNLEREFEQDGPFIGAAYGIPIRHGFLDGLLAFNLAVAFLDGEVTETERNRTITFDGIPTSVAERKAVIEGDSTGLTLGLSWKGSTPIEGLSYLVSVDGYKYEFDGDKVELEGQTIAVDTRFDETVINLRVGATYLF